MDFISFLRRKFNHLSLYIDHRNWSFTFVIHLSLSFGHLCLENHSPQIGFGSNIHRPFLLLSVYYHAVICITFLWMSLYSSPHSVYLLRSSLSISLPFMCLVKSSPQSTIYFASAICSRNDNAKWNENSCWIKIWYIYEKIETFLC